MESFNKSRQKKQVLLVMPKVAYMYDDWPVPPVGIPYISSFMKKWGISVHCLNLSLYEGRIQTVLEKIIRDNKIDIVATGDLVVNYRAVKEIVDCAKMVSKDIVTIIGGGLVTHSPEEAMQLIPNADYGVIGEGEVTDTELVLALEEGRDPKKVAGIIYRENSELYRTLPRQAIEDLDELPWPDYEGFDYFEVERKVMRKSGGGWRNCWLSCSAYDQSFLPVSVYLLFNIRWGEKISTKIFGFYFCRIRIFGWNIPCKGDFFK